MCYLRQITGQRELQREDGTWRQVTAEKVLGKAGNQSLVGGELIKPKIKKNAGIFCWNYLMSITLK